MRFFLILMMVLFLGLSGGAAWFFFGGVEDDPARKYEQAYQARIDTLLPKANAGDAKAQLKIARLYRDARDDLKDIAQAVIWLEKASNSTSSVARYELGRLYEQGLGVPKDYMRAFRLYKASAGLGRYRKAQFALGNLYFKGRGTLQNYDLAIDWFRKAAWGGHPIAQYLLGAMYSEGWAMDVDAMEAYMWLSLALPYRQQVQAHNKKYDPARELHKLRSRMTLTGQNEAEKRIRSWQPK